MPEPTDLLAGLGDELAGLARPPQFEELVTRGRRRRHRRQVLGSAAAVVLVAAATGVGLQLSRVTANTAPPTGRIGPVRHLTTLTAGAFQPGTVTFVGPDTGWAYGADRTCHPACGALAVTTDGGHSWAPEQTTGLPAGYLTGARLRFLNLQHGWLWRPGHGLYATHNAGQTWALVPLPGQVEDLEASTGYAYATVHTGAGDVLMRSPADVDRWAPVPGVNLPGPGTVVLSGGGPSAWVFGGGRAFWSPDGGLWKTGRVPCGDVTALFAGPMRTVFVLCAGPTSTVRAYLSVDGGASFQHLTDPPATGAVVDVAATDTGLYVTESAGGRSYVYMSPDAGRSWQLDYSGNGALVDFGFTTDAQGVAVQGVPPGDSRLLMTTDGGRTWSPVAF